MNHGKLTFYVLFSIAIVKRYYIFFQRVFALICCTKWRTSLSISMSMAKQTSEKLVSVDKGPEKGEIIIEQVLKLSRPNPGALVNSNN